MTTFRSAPLIGTGGTSFHDVVINDPYTEVVRKLGAPHATYTPGGKVQYEWTFRSEDGRVATVYDWKEYGNQFPTEWHVGGHSPSVTREFAAWYATLS